MLKRAMDIIFALAGLIILVPVFLVLAILIRMDSQGGIFYLQERIGRRRVPFRLFKFRTMHVNADRFTAITVGKRDARITRLGYWLRRFKIDELPQLINVLKGDMSLVGPRPELKRFVDLYTADQLKVLDVRPGITDLASIEYRNENEMLDGQEDPVGFYIREIMPRKLALNLVYIRNQSVLYDLKIIFRTLFSIFKK